MEVLGAWGPRVAAGLSGQLLRGGVSDGAEEEDECGKVVWDRQRQSHGGAEQERAPREGKGKSLSRPGGQSAVGGQEGGEGPGMRGRPAAQGHACALRPEEGHGQVGPLGKHSGSWGDWTWSGGDRRQRNSQEAVGVTEEGTGCSEPSQW